jgi:chemotaxis response regulator CheB
MVQRSLEQVPHQEGRKIRLLIADNSRIHTELLSDALESDSGLDVVSWNSDPLSLIPTSRTHNVDVLAISAALRVGAIDAFEIVRQLRAGNPKPKRWSYSIPRRMRT